MLGEGISQFDLQRADMLLNNFTSLVVTLYDPSLVSLNVHNLTHLAAFVEKWGIMGMALLPF